MNPIYGVNDSVVDIRLGEDETKLKAEIIDNLPDFAVNVDHSSDENVETEARNKDDVLNNAIVEFISNNAIVIDTKFGEPSPPPTPAQPQAKSGGCRQNSPQHTLATRVEGAKGRTITQPISCFDDQYRQRKLRKKQQNQSVDEISELQGGNKATGLATQGSQVGNKKRIRYDSYLARPGNKTGGLFEAKTQAKISNLLKIRPSERKTLE